MSKKRKVFGISQSINRGLNETVNIVENNEGLFRNAVVPISRLEADPENPRKLFIKKEELLSGPSKDDPRYKEKMVELDKLNELAKTIISKGLLQPITVYKYGENYRIVAGNRRYMASLIAHKTEVEARVLNKPPRTVDLKLIQWIENTARDDLTINDRLGNIESIICESQRLDDKVKVTPSVLSQLTGLSDSQSCHYLSVVHAPTDVRSLLTDGRLTNIEKASLLAGIKDDELRQKAIAACLKNCTVKQLKELIKNQKRNNLLAECSEKNKNVGRPRSKISLGITKHTEVVKKLVEAVLESPALQIPKEHFVEIDWSDFHQAGRAFRQLLKLLEPSTGK